MQNSAVVNSEMWLSNVFKAFLLILFYVIQTTCGQSILVSGSYGNHLKGGYQPTWESLDKRPLPQWYDEAKVGIFIHWGVYAVPSFGTEWFWINWKDYKHPDYVKYMEENFRPHFSYQEFARDFTAEHFHPEDWATLFEKSGAKYVVLTSKHHEGYAMWPSKYSFSWNSMDVGPHRDIIGELSTAIRLHTPLKFGLYHSLYEWFNPLYLDDKLHIFTKSEFVDYKVFPELQELVTRYKPEIVWSDGEWEATDDYWKSKEFLAWLFNESPVKDTVVTNDRWGMNTLCKHGSFYTCSDRYNPGVLQEHKWENAMTIDKQSWGYRANAKLSDYLSSKDLIKELVSTVSCGGNMLVNVGPTKEGLIMPIFEERLLDMGRWLGINGDAIYSSIPWKYQNDTQTAGVWYTTRAAKSDEEVVYAIVLNFPYRKSGVNLYALKDLNNKVTRIEMLGYAKQLKWYGSKESIYVVFPPKDELDDLGLDLAWTIQITILK